ncbi:MAG: xanthine dehydrogenase family protein [Firmicutes bacterium]|nr:xanthine dehydrogenase family protein [Bacillota bacterium]
MSHPEWKFIGKNLKRVEDPRFLRGKARYIDDIKLPGMLHAAVLRSPYGHARIKSIDISRALQVPGVITVLTGEDCKQRMNPCMNFGPTTVAQYPLAVDKVRYWGEAVAAVVAESRYAAEDGVEAIEVEYEPLPVVVDPFLAMEPGAPLVHEAHGSNIVHEQTFEFGDVSQCFAEADIVVRDKLRWGRSSGMPLETTGAIGNPTPNGGLEIYANSMNFTYFMWLIASALKLPSNKLTVIPVNAGGSFGSKFTAHKVPTLAGFLALATGRPVKYVEDRLDHMANSDHHGSDRYYEVELALKKDGTMTGLRIDCVDDYGAYLQFGVGTHGNALSQVVGPYRIKHVSYRLRAVLTNKCQQGAYRGFGAEVNNWVLERMVDKAARTLGMLPEELRRRNFIQPHEFPYKIPTGNIYDSGNYEAVLNKAIELADLPYWREEQKRARAEGRYIGIGITTAQERSVFSSTEFWMWFDKPAFPVTSSPESATISIDPAGNFHLKLHSQAMWGNSPETVATMVLAEQFGIDPHQVNVTYADSAHALPSTGPGGSRFTVMVSGAVVGASKMLKDKLFRIAAHLLEARPEDVELVDGRVQVKGAPQRSKTLAELAAVAHFFALSLPPGMESGLEASHTYDHPYTTLPSDDRKDLGVFYPFMGHACHIAVIELDVKTGQHKFLKYVAVHDAGTVVNPRTLAGHVTGGATQGLGTALYEEYVYDENGQLKTSTFMDYLIPTAMEVPEFEIGHVETPSPFTEYGIKGGGEGGRMLTPAVMSAAIDDALAQFGVRVTALPVTPAHITRMVREGQG